MNRRETPSERAARLDRERYEHVMGKPPPDPVDDWQLNYRGTPEERARLAVWLGYEDDEQQPQIDQEESLF